MASQPARQQRPGITWAILVPLALAGYVAPAQTARVQTQVDPRPAATPAPAPARPGVIVVGSDVYPKMTVATDQPRFDPDSSVLANTVAAKTGLFGAAAREGVTWAERYVPGTDITGRVQLYALSTTGYYGAFFGSRSSDNTSSNPEHVIGSINLVVADSDRPNLHWAHYSEGYVPRGKKAFRLLINDENSIQNEGDPAPTADPYDFNPQQLLNNLRVDCGIGMAGAQSCTNPLSILNNGARYRTGIIFGSDSIDVVNGAATAIALPVQYGLSWFAAPGTPTWRVYADARAPGAGKLVLGDDAVSFQLGNATAPGLRIEKDAIHSPATIAAGKVPVMSGTCPVRDQRGGATAGAFALGADCADAVLTLDLGITAPTGWACVATDMTRGTASLRQTGYSATGVTFAVSRARQADAIVFSCNGF